MAYNRKNLLAKVKKVNQIYLKYKAIGCTTIAIYNLYIKDQFDISYTTFNAYLAIPYEKQLKEIERKEEERKKQLLLELE